MSEPTPIPLKPVPVYPVTPHNEEFNQILRWPFQDSYIHRVLEQDIPQRAHFGGGRLWVYRDPNEVLVGFGTIDICDEYGDFTGGLPHPYIPLLAVNPSIQSRGYGTGIMRHLVDEAAVLASGRRRCHDVLFLDVYTDNQKAIALYTKFGFTPLADEPRPDSQEAGRSYIVMARRVAVDGE